MMPLAIVILMGELWLLRLLVIPDAAAPGHSGASLTSEKRILLKKRCVARMRRHVL